MDGLRETADEVGDHAARPVHLRLRGVHGRAARRTDRAELPIAGPAVVGDSCALARPDFGGVATAADRALFAYDVDAPLNLQKTVESTTNGVELSAITFGSPDGGSVTGVLLDPVERSSLRPGIVLMHGMPGSAASWWDTRGRSPSTARW
jgi:hypothetical protein